MMKKIIHGFIILLLLIAITGVSSSMVYCAHMDKLISTKCCTSNNQDGKECCREIKIYNRVESKVVVPSKTTLPDYFTIAIVYFTFNNYNTLAVPHSDLTYSPPRATRDIPVFVSCFRI